MALWRAATITNLLGRFELVWTVPVQIHNAYSVRANAFQQTGKVPTFAVSKEEGRRQKGCGRN